MNTATDAQAAIIYQISISPSLRFEFGADMSSSEARSSKPHQGMKQLERFVGLRLLRLLGRHKPDDIAMMFRVRCGRQTDEQKQLIKSRRQTSG